MKNFEQIKVIQNDLHNRLGTNILHVLNGEEMLKIFTENGLMQVGDFIPFNEAMCYGPSSKTIFSEEFIEIRSDVHRVSKQEYRNHVVDRFDPLKQQNYAGIILWFGSDMFCQINLLTLLAYLSQIDYQGQIIFHLIDEHAYEVEVIKITNNHYQKIYEQVVIQHTTPEEEMFPVLAEGVKLYLHYQQPNNELTQFIREHPDIDTKELLTKLFITFPHYRLGDIQYMQLIQSERSST